jgi:hypothetical protein
MFGRNNNHSNENSNGNANNSKNGNSNNPNNRNNSNFSEKELGKLKKVSYKNSALDMVYDINIYVTNPDKTFVRVQELVEKNNPESFSYTISNDADLDEDAFVAKQLADVKRMINSANSDTTLKIEGEPTTLDAFIYNGRDAGHVYHFIFELDDTYNYKYSIKVHEPLTIRLIMNVIRDSIIDILRRSYGLKKLLRCVNKTSFQQKCLDDILEVYKELLIEAIDINSPDKRINITFSGFFPKSAKDANSNSNE